MKFCSGAQEIFEFEFHQARWFFISSSCEQAVGTQRSAATIDTRLRYFASALDGGDADEESMDDPGDGCRGWRNRRDRTGTG
jgi:hypothetical protein